MTANTTASPLYRVNGIGKSYSRVQALAPLRLSIDEGETVAVVGPSGAGKTTLLHLLAGVIQPDSGSIGLNGHTLSDLRPGRELSALVGVIHQQFDLVPHLSVLHNVLAGRLGRWGLLESVRSLLSPRELDVAQRALERVGIAEYAEANVRKLSGGQQQRVALARSLALEPEVMLLDEPFSSLDAFTREALQAEVGALVHELGITTVVTVPIITNSRDIENGEELLLEVEEPSAKSKAEKQRNWTSAPCGSWTRCRFLSTSWHPRQTLHWPT